MNSPCECEHNKLDSLDARLFPSVVLAAAPAVTMDEASSLSPTSNVNTSSLAPQFANIELTSCAEEGVGEDRRQAYEAAIQVRVMCRP